MSDYIVEELLNNEKVLLYILKKTNNQSVAIWCINKIKKIKYCKGWLL